MELDPNNDELVLKRSSADDVWNKLSDHQKIHIIKSHANDFGLTEDELKPILFTLPFTEQEINAAYAVNNGGAVLYPAGTPVESSYNRRVIARIDKFQKDGTAVITTFSVKDTESCYDAPIVIVVHTKTVAIEDYVVGTFVGVDAKPILYEVDVDILTKYTIFKSRCEQFGYPEDIARKRLINDFKHLFRLRTHDLDEHSVLDYMKHVYANGVAIYNMTLKSTLIHYMTDYRSPNSSSIAQMHSDWLDVNSHIISELLKTTGIDVTPIISDPSSGYDMMRSANIDSLVVWMSRNFKYSGIPYSEYNISKVRICTTWINFDEWNDFDGLVDHINLLLVPCNYLLDIMLDENPSVNMWVKLTKL